MKQGDPSDRRIGMISQPFKGRIVSQNPFHRVLIHPFVSPQVRHEISCHSRQRERHEELEQLGVKGEEKVPKFHRQVKYGYRVVKRTHVLHLRRVGRKGDDVFEKEDATCVQQVHFVERFELHGVKVNPTLASEEPNSRPKYVQGAHRYG